MDIKRIAPTDSQHIQRYGPGGFVVSGIEYTGPVIVFPKITQVWAVKRPCDLMSGDFVSILDQASELDLCLLGVGGTMHKVSEDVRETLRAAGVNIEPMDTGAACRTFNVLLAEGRAVAAALFPTGNT